MVCMIDGKSYRLIKNAIQSNADRTAYFELAKKIFGLDFSIWYRSGFCGDSFIPYTLYDNDAAIASVGVAVGEFQWQNSTIQYCQISTVMTDSFYRGRGLSRWLMELVLAEWTEKSDFIYLYANDSVLDFYPRFGFVKRHEYLYSIPICKKAGAYRNLDLHNPNDMALLTEKCKFCNNPFSALSMMNNFSHLMFHCVTFLYNDIFYVDEYDAVVIAEYRDDVLFCHDIFTTTQCNMADILAVFARETPTTVKLGFTPRMTGHCKCEELIEPNTTLFTLKTKRDIWSGHNITFPFLARA